MQSLFLSINTVDLSFACRLQADSNNKAFDAHLY